MKRRDVSRRRTSSSRTIAPVPDIIERIVSMVGRRIDESSPMVDARLQDGSRVNAMRRSRSTGPVLSNPPFSHRDIGLARGISSDVSLSRSRCSIFSRSASPPG